MADNGGMRMLRLAGALGYAQLTCLSRFLADPIVRVLETCWSVSMKSCTWIALFSDHVGTRLAPMAWERLAKGNAPPQMVWNVADAELSTPAAACCKIHGSDTVDLHWIAWRGPG